MAETCLTCAHFDPEDTELPVCVLHRRFMHGEWTCGDFESIYDREGDDGETDQGQV